MQYKSLFYLVFLKISQYLCPKNAFSPVYIDIKILIVKEIYDEFINQKTSVFYKIKQIISKVSYDC